MIPANYIEWRDCIEYSCGIALTEKYIRQRLAELTDLNNSSTKTFRERYGSEHTINIIQWFEQALRERLG